MDLPLNDPGSIWVVVNKGRPLHPRNYTPDDLVTTALGEAPVRAVAEPSLEEMATAARLDGLTLAVMSGYRSFEAQTAVYSAYLENHGRAGAEAYVARPGCSEHQTGLAIDIRSAEDGVMAHEFDPTLGRWVAANSHRFGWIVRYPEDKTAFTGYAYEPWHLRYVGPQLAAELHLSGKTMEEHFRVYSRLRVFHFLSMRWLARHAPGPLRGAARALRERARR